MRMKSNEKINVYGKSGHFAKNKIIYFSDYPDKFYEELVKVFVDEDILQNSFTDNEWYLYNKLTSYYVQLNFNLNEKFNNALKRFILLKMKIGRAASTIVGEFNNIKELAIISEYFTNLNEYKKYMEKRVLCTKSANTRIASNLLSFLNFYNDSSLNDYIQYTVTLKSNTKNNTDLPDFNDVLVFDEIVNDYFKNSDAEQYKKYLIIYMWWTLTNIIPMRPSEFLSIRKNCLHCDLNSNNPYSMYVPRLKDKNSLRKKVIDEDRVYLNKETYTKISKAMNIFLQIESESEFLFSIESHYKLSSNPFYKKKSKAKRIYHGIFKKILENFYEEVVQGIYQEAHLDKVTQGDTRHFAIINLVLQGFNILSIAELAGHKKIESAEAYYNHAETFAQSFVYKLSKNKLENILQSSIPDGLIGWKSYVIDKGKIYNIDSKSNIVGKINDYGYCIEQKDNFPTTCISDCRLCEKYVFKPTEENMSDGIGWLKDSSSLYKQRISEVIQYMLEISVSVKHDNTHNINEKLKTKASELNGLISMKALIESYLIGVDGDD